MFDYIISKSIYQKEKNLYKKICTNLFKLHNDKLNISSHKNLQINQKPTIQKPFNFLNHKKNSKIIPTCFSAAPSLYNSSKTSSLSILNVGNGTNLPNLALSSLPCNRSLSFLSLQKRSFSNAISCSSRGESLTTDGKFGPNEPDNEES